MLFRSFPIVPRLYSPPYTTDRPAIGLNAVDPTLRTPNLQQWCLNVQSQITSSTLVEIGYAGTKGSNLATMRLINQALLASAANPVNGQTTNTSANAALRVPYVGFSCAGLVWLETSRLLVSFPAGQCDSTLIEGVTSSGFVHMVKVTGQ